MLKLLHRLPKARDLAAALGLGAVAAVAPPAFANSISSAPMVDTALILAIDVSNSVDAERYTLQMEGVARALEDPGVISAITAGAEGGILLTLVAWSDRAEVALPWQTIHSSEDAARVAELVRRLPQNAGEYTCTSRMLEFVKEIVVPDVPASARRIVLDVSGDGIDNCAIRQASDRERDALVAAGVTINGLPIIVKGENDIVGSGAYRAPGYALEDLGPDKDTTTLDAWYRDHVIAGPGAFLKTAQGFEDFGRAFRQKFVTEISSFSARYCNLDRPAQSHRRRSARCRG